MRNNNQKIFFVAQENEVNQYLNTNSGKTLEDINIFTNTATSYRCNLRVYKNNEGYSSYQSDYPFQYVLYHLLLLALNNFQYSNHHVRIQTHL